MKFACRAGLEHPTRGQLVVGVLEHASVGPLVRRLRCLSLLLEVGDDRLDLVPRARLELELHGRHDLAVAKIGMPVPEPELIGRPPVRAVAVDDECTNENARPVAAVRARVHPHTAADGSGDGARELESAEVCGPCAMEADGVRGAAARDEQVVLRSRGGQVAAELQHERVDTVVGDQEIRAESDGRDGHVVGSRPGERFGQLVERAGSCERARGTAGSDRRESRERDALLDLQSNASSSSEGARSTSPAPSVNRRSPGRARAAR